MQESNSEKKNCSKSSPGSKGMKDRRRSLNQSSDEDEKHAVGKNTFIHPSVHASRSRESKG
jgi:hypothetical protein